MVMAATTTRIRARARTVVSSVTATATIVVDLSAAIASYGVAVTNAVVGSFDGRTFVASEQLPLVTESARDDDDNEFTVSVGIYVTVECTVHRGHRWAVVTYRWIVVPTASRYDLDVVIVVDDDVAWSPTESGTIIALHIVVDARYCYCYCCYW